LGTAVFVAAEFAIVAVDSAVLDAAVAPGRLGALRRALSSASLYLSASQVGITLTTIGLGYTAQPAAARLVAQWLKGNPALSQAAGAALAATIALVFVNTLSMLVGELIPKNLAMAEPLRTARWALPALLVFTQMMRPVIWLLHSSSTGLLKAIHFAPADEVSSARSAEELDSVVRHSAEEGVLDEDLATRLRRTLALTELKAVDAMTDRTQLAVLPRSASAAEVIEVVAATGHSRLPVIDGSRDNILGVVALRKALAVPYARRSRVSVTGLMTPIVEVPETAELGPVLVQLRDAGAQMAVVVDEYGGTSGVITLEDVVEEIVGDVRDENDPTRPAVRLMADGSWRVPAQMRPDELADQAGIELPENAAYETLGGLVMAQLGRVPKPGDQVTVAGVTIRVEAMAGRRAVALRVWGRPKEP
jgi:CBS domain containing-hemolysin-like protein